MRGNKRILCRPIRNNAAGLHRLLGNQALCVPSPWRYIEILKPRALQWN